jgi:hypothetical protein
MSGRCGTTLADPAGRLTQRRILRFWSPLAATWLMMAAEGPFLAAVIARLGDPAYNLAAFGVAMALAMIVEAPVIMMMSAATALVRDRQSLLALRRFAWRLNAVVTAVMAVVLLPPVFRLIALDVLGLPAPIERLAHQGVAVLLLWPAAIGYRRFYQGLLIRHHLTRRVAWGTVVRLATMATTALLLSTSTGAPGASVGTAALGLGVIVEAAASRLMARGVARDLLARDADAGEALTGAAILRFYAPLAVTSLLILGIQPLLTFFLARGRLPVESLAVLPVVSGLLFMLRSPGIGFQEAALALAGERREHVTALRRFAATLAVALSGMLAVIAFTPLARLWFEGVTGLTPALATLAAAPTRLLVAMPALEVLLALQRALLLLERTTRPITVATGLEVAVLALALTLLTGPVGLVGIVAVGVALPCGRVVANLYLRARLGGVPASAGGRRR